MNKCAVCDRPAMENSNFCIRHAPYVLGPGHINERYRPGHVYDKGRRKRYGFAKNHSLQRALNKRFRLNSLTKKQLVGLLEDSFARQEINDMNSYMKKVGSKGGKFSMRRNIKNRR